MKPQAWVSQAVVSHLHQDHLGSGLKMQNPGLHETKNFLYNGGNHQQNEKKPTEWEKIIAKDTFPKGLISKIYKEHTTQHQQNKKFT